MKISPSLSGKSVAKIFFLDREEGGRGHEKLNAFVFNPSRRTVLLSSVKTCVSRALTFHFVHNSFCCSPTWKEVKTRKTMRCFQCGERFVGDVMYLRRLSASFRRSRTNHSTHSRISANQQLARRRHSRNAHAHKSHLMENRFAWMRWA